MHLSRGVLLPTWDAVIWLSWPISRDRCSIDLRGACFKFGKMRWLQSAVQGRMGRHGASYPRCLCCADAESWILRRHASFTVSNGNGSRHF